MDLDNRTAAKVPRGARYDRPDARSEETVILVAEHSGSLRIKVRMDQCHFLTVSLSTI